jgi:orotidine-5'-phosphate decarboxylase
MTRNELIESIKRKESFLCVGLDSDIEKIPPHLLALEDPVFAFNKAIIDATLPYTVAYKPNMAFYENRGVEGWKSLEKTIQYLNALQEKVFTIADAKRGDIGNTSRQYAKAFFETLNFDALTVAPYMGKDSVEPFFTYNNKWVVLLALTSNQGAFDFQFFQSNISATLEKFGIKLKDDKRKLFEQVIIKAQEWGNPENLMFVVGATKAEMLKNIREIAPNHFLLVPGVGAQGGSLEEVAENGLNKDVGILVNSSRSIIFASKEENFAEVAKHKAQELQNQMSKILKNHVIA